MADGDPFAQFSNTPPPAGQPVDSASMAAARKSVRSDLPQPDVNEVTRGVTLGFSDDINAAYESAHTALNNLVLHLQGKPLPYTSRQTEQATREELRKERVEHEAQHPVLSTVESLGGSLATPGIGEANAGLKALGVGALGRSAAIGGGLGGLAGVGNSDGGLKDTVKAGLEGTAAGMATGSALHGATLVGGHVTKRLVSAAQEALDRIKSMQGYERGAPPSAAMRARGEVVGREQVRRIAQRLDPTGEKLGANRVEQSGKPITAAEALGRPAETQLKVAGRRMGQTPDALEAQLRTRRAETSDRIVKDFGELTGLDPETVEGDFTESTDKARAAAAPLYERAYAIGQVESPKLESLLQRDAIKKALVRARRIASNEGRNPDEIGLVTRTTMQQSNLQTSGGNFLAFPMEEQVEVKNPTMQTWDYIKRGLDAELEASRDPVTGKLGKGEDIRSITTAVRDLRAELTNPETHWGPAYRAALDAGGEAPRQEEAWHAAKRLMASTVSESDFAKRLKDFTPAQVNALKAGVVNQIRNAAQAGRQRLGEMVTPAFKAKMVRLFGQHVADEMEQRIEDERFLMAHGQRMTPGIGSDTSETLLGDEEQRNAAKEAAVGIRKVFKGHILDGLIHFLGSSVEGAYRGAQLPQDEATRDVLGALLSKSPSELAKVLQEHGAAPGEAAHITALMDQAGFFGSQASGVISELMGKGAAMVGRQFETPSSSTDKKPDDSGDDPFAKFKSDDTATKQPASDTSSDSLDLDKEPKAYTSNADMTDYLAYHLGTGVHITSSYRDPEHNAEVGGAPNSAHTRGEAWDFKADGMTNYEAGMELAHSGMPFDQIEITPTHVHISFDPRNRGQVIVVGDHRESTQDTDNSDVISAAAYQPDPIDTSSLNGSDSLSPDMGGL